MTEHNTEKTVCPFCSSEWVTAAQHDRNVDRLEQEQRNVTEQEHDVLMNSIKASSTVVSKGFLAQPEQEQVEWGVDWGPDGSSVSIIKRLADGGIEVVGWEYAPHPPQRKPLTDEETIILKGTTCPEIDWKARHGVEMNNGERNQWMLDWFMAFKVAIEAAHGIKENT